MSRAEIMDFLTVKSHIAKLASVRPAAGPQITTVWFSIDGGDLIIINWHTTMKGRNLRLTPRAADCVDDVQPPYLYMLLEGAVYFSEDLEELRGWPNRIGSKYIGADQTEAFGIRCEVPGELLGRLKINHRVGQANIAD